MAQVKVDEAQEGRQRRIEAWLTAVAMALALPHLLEPETTGALLGLVGLEVPHTESGLTESGHLIVLVAQVFIIMAVALLAGLLVMRLLGKRRRHGSSWFKVDV